MALDTMIEKLVNARKAYDEQLAQLGENAAKEVAAYLSTNIPEGFCLEWTQYTPYFNDGDACTFRVNDAYIYPRKFDEDGDEIREPYAEENENSIGLSSYYVQKYGVETYTNWRGDVNPGDPEQEGLPRATLVALAEAWKKIPGDMLNAAFGDHTKVRIFANGEFESDDYDHD